MSTLSFLSSLISKQPNISINNKGSAKINEFSPLVIYSIVPQKNTEKKARLSFRRPGSNVI